MITLLLVVSVPTTTMLVLSKVVDGKAEVKAVVGTVLSEDEIAAKDVVRSAIVEVDGSKLVADAIAELVRLTGRVVDDAVAGGGVE
jgi:hypothetical protein